MREFLLLLSQFDWRGLFLSPTKNSFLQFFRYIFVGGIASLADWAVLFFLTLGGLYYLFSTAAGFLAGLLVNFILSKAIVFHGSKARVNAAAEFLAYALIGVIGLAFTLVLMYLFTEIGGLYFMVSKIITTLAVLLWNYFARKLCLYH